MALLKYSDELVTAAKHWPGRPSAPSAYGKTHRKGVRFYENGWVERIFTWCHPASPLLYFGPFITYGLYVSLSTRWWLTVAGLFAAGVLAWTLAEYLLHRFFFHLVVEEDDKKLPFFLVHGYHHEYPQDRLRLVAPFIASWTGGALFLLLYYLIAGPELCWALFAGTGAGYVGYDSIHFYTHHAKPRTRVGRWLQRYHLQHHYRDAQSHYGISNPLWDLVFGTFASRWDPEAPTSASTTQQGLNPPRA